MRTAHQPVDRSLAYASVTAIRYDSLETARPKQVLARDEGWALVAMLLCNVCQVTGHARLIGCRS